jgi:hypothetical protein
MKTGLRVIQKMIMLALLSHMVLFGRAQTNLIFYNSNDQFNSPGFNPAFLTHQKKFTFGIFPLSGMSVGYNDQEVVKGMLKNFLSGSLTNANMTDVFKSLLEKDLFSQRFETSLFNFGYNSGNGSFNFRINEIEQLRSGLKGNFTQFISDPEFQTIKLNQPQLLSADGVHYREYSLGYAREVIKSKLSLGVRAKIYFGKASFFSEAQGKATVDNGRYFLQTNDPVKMAVPVNFVVNPEDSIISGATARTNFTPLNYLFNNQNLGIGIDLGITYKVNPKMLLTGSIVDFGKIKWNSNLSILNLKGKFEILPQYILDPGVDYVTKNPSFSTDSLNRSELFKTEIDSSAYSTHLPTSIYIGAQYQINPTLKLGVVNRYIQSKGMGQNSFNLSANFEVNQKLTLIAGYSTIGKSYANIPFALIYNWGSGQSYLGTDNLLAFFIPSKVDYAGITFGTCFYLFKPKVKYKESEYLPFYKEKKHNIR